MDDAWIERIAERVIAKLREDPPTQRSRPQVRRLIAERRLRDRYFAAALFADPAWDILLHLYASALEATEVSVSSLCVAAAAPPTTALRWLARLYECGLVERHPDPFDKRRAFMRLTTDANSRMEAYFTATTAAPRTAIKP